jgi:hypothetical protein
MVGWQILSSKGAKRFYDTHDRRERHIVLRLEQVHTTSDERVAMRADVITIIDIKRLPTGKALQKAVTIEGIACHERRTQATRPGIIHRRARRLGVVLTAVAAFRTRQRKAASWKRPARIREWLCGSRACTYIDRQLPQLGKFGRHRLAHCPSNDCPWKSAVPLRTLPFSAGTAPW